MNVKVYVEGGGDHNKALDTECRRGFKEFFRKAGLERRMPRIVSCGARSGAYNSFRTSHENAGDDDFPMLLVDSEAPVSGGDAWEHVRTRDGWQLPDGATPDQLHLMVQAMEAWSRNTIVLASAPRRLANVQKLITSRKPTCLGV